MLWQKVIGGTSAAKLPILSYITNVSQVTTASTFTFNSVSLGTADASRIIVVNVGGLRATSAGQRRVASATIAGVSATIVQNPYYNNVASIVYAEVPTGNTGTIIINIEGNSTNNQLEDCVIGVYSVINLSSTSPIASGTNTGGSSATVSLSSSADGVAIYCGSTGGTTTNVDYTNATKNYQVVNSNRVRSGASVVTTGSTISVTASSSGSPNVFLSGATWR
jgi:hypothetical protein